MKALRASRLFDSKLNFGWNSHFLVAPGPCAVLMRFLFRRAALQIFVHCNQEELHDYLVKDAVFNTLRKMSMTYEEFVDAILTCAARKGLPKAATKDVSFDLVLEQFLEDLLTGGPEPF